MGACSLLWVLAHCCELDSRSSRHRARPDYRCRTPTAPPGTDRAPPDAYYGACQHARAAADTVSHAAAGALSHAAGNLSHALGDASLEVSDHLSHAVSELARATPNTSHMAGDSSQGSGAGQPCGATYYVVYGIVCWCACTHWCAHAAIRMPACVSPTDICAYRSTLRGFASCATRPALWPRLGQEYARSDGSDVSRRTVGG